MVNRFPTQNEWKKILRDAVQFAPIVNDLKGNPIKCRRPNSFTYIYNVWDIYGADNNTADPNTDAFFDRELELTGSYNDDHAVSTPAVKFRERTWQADNFFSQESSSIINGNLFVLDSAHNLKEGVTYCETRTIDQVFSDCNYIVQDIFLYIKRLCYTEEAGFVTEAIAIEKSWAKSVIPGLRNDMIRVNKDILGRPVQNEGSGGYSGVMYQLNLPYHACGDGASHQWREYPKNKIGTR